MNCSQIYTLRRKRKNNGCDLKSIRKMKGAKENGFPVTEEQEEQEDDLYFLFYWNIVDLQCCVTFSYTAKWLSYIYICILLHILFHYSLLQDIEYTFLCYIRMIFIKWSFLYISVPNRETRMEFYSCKLASPIQWTWTCANSGRCWGTGRPGVLQSMGLQRVGQDWSTTTAKLGHISNCLSPA